jgi:hypothetical protein
MGLTRTFGYVGHAHRRYVVFDYLQPSSIYALLHFHVLHRHRWCIGRLDVEDRRLVID